MMTRMLSGISLGLCVLWIGMLLFIRAQPTTQDADLRNFLMPTDCDSTCLFGILPGETDIEGAVQLLEAQGLVQQWLNPPERERAKFAPTLLMWEWSTLRPAFFNTDRGSLMFNRDDGQVRSIGTLQTTVPLGQVIATFGEAPNRLVQTALRDGGQRAVIYMAQYAAGDFGFTVVSYTECPFSYTHLLESTVSFEIKNVFAEYARFSPYPDDMMRFMRDANRVYC
jgi:hypothetical protein